MHFSSSTRSTRTFVLFSSGCTSISGLELKPRAQQSFATKLIYLQYLDLADCLRVDDSSLAAIARSAPNLLQLYLRRCSNVTGKKENDILFSALKELASFQITTI